MRTGAKKERPFRVVKIGLTRPREALFDRINRRVTAMVDEGFLEEAHRVLPYRDCNALNTVGYKEIFRYFDGDWALDMALDRMRKEYARVCQKTTHLVATRRGSTLVSGRRWSARARVGEARAREWDDTSGRLLIYNGVGERKGTKGDANPSCL